MTEKSSLLRRIPKVDALVEAAAARDDLAALARPLLVEVVRSVVDRRRAALVAGDETDVEALFGEAGFVAAVRDAVSDLLRRKHQGVVNATGILLHTGLGRAPLSDAAIEAARDAARYAVVEVDPDTGERDLRENRIAALLCELTGAEAATVVNNNAAACLLTLRALAEGREAIVARGELVEIGGGFRMPDVMAASGCRMVEVGTTNRTYARDYEAALTDAAGLLLKVHTSNFRVVGFTHAPAEEDLAALARSRGVPYVHDLGSGMLRPVAVSPLEDEPSVRASVETGADVVLFSGDKLLCGPQGGLIVGRREWIERIRRHPLYRAVRPGKLELAALEATLLAWRRAPDGLPDLPLYRMLGLGRPALDARVERVTAGLAGASGVRAEALDTEGFLGSGSAPVRRVASRAVALDVEGLRADRLADLLRRGCPRVYARIEEDRVLLDVRTVFDEELEPLIAAVTDAVSRGRESQP